MASSAFFKDGKYDLDFKNPKPDKSKMLDGKQLAEYYLELITKYPVISIEDPFDQDDWDSWSFFNSKNKTQMIADDLTVTNPNRIKTAIEKNAANCLLLKLNQIGTVSESIQACVEHLQTRGQCANEPIDASSPSQTDGGSKFPIGVVKQRVRTSRTSLLALGLDRSRLALPRGASASPSTTNCSALSKRPGHICVWAIANFYS